MTSPENQEKTIRYLFGDFELDEATLSLKAAGEDVAIQRRAWDLLLYLVKHRDRVVDKDELQSAVWPGMVVTETALTRAIMKARRAVNDDAQAPQWIKTVHGRGYRFVGEVREAAGQDLAEPASPTPLEAAAEQTPVAVGVSHAQQGAAGLVPSDAAAPPQSSATPDVQQQPLRLAIGALILVFVAALFWTLRPTGVDEPAAPTRVAVLPFRNLSGDAEFDYFSDGVEDRKHNVPFRRIAPVRVALFEAAV